MAVETRVRARLDPTSRWLLPLLNSIQHLSSGVSTKIQPSVCLSICPSASGGLFAIIMAANKPEQPCMAYINVVMMSNIFRVLHWSYPPFSILAIAERKQTAQPRPGPPLIGPLTRTPSPGDHDRQCYSLQREHPTTNKPTETKTPKSGAPLPWLLVSLSPGTGRFLSRANRRLAT